ncbi:hypothetical protein F5X68DRAFT_72577 [Plectosphaerella plurivora]|uniref:Zn(2)-C6 fungal-type domain-containing protein n=1 Tax=Plectosphaerella plurivora TaxID=936078 RepID=A0A9P8UV62_9PEZI|nr:hypothetical protein F5X68DRAFT_72577 [Plectosphaerella plurivora]
MSAAETDILPVAAPDARPPKRSAHACTRCRQQKMRCIHGPLPPCDRCRRSNSACVFEPPHLPRPPPSYMPYSTPILSGDLASNPFLGHAMMPLSKQPSNVNPDVATSSTSSQRQSPTRTSVTAISQHANSTESQQNTSVSPAQSAPSHARKRRRLEDTQQQSPGCPEERSGSTNDTEESTPTASSPYRMVQDFEAVHRPQKLSEADRTATAPAPFLDRPAMELSYDAMFSRAASGKTSVAHCLAAVNLSAADAQDMFALFGERVAPFTPWLYDTDFSSLPEDPLWALASIRVMARYLPGASSLTSRLDRVIGGLLRHVMFDDLYRPYDAAMETIKGLGILYGYSEVSVADSVGDAPKKCLDPLCIKGIIEGYAVRWGISKPTRSNAFGCLVWLWLHSMSNVYSILLGCPRTLPEGRTVQRAREVVEKLDPHPQITALLGEVDAYTMADPDMSAYGWRGTGSASEVHSTIQPSLADRSPFMRHVNPELSEQTGEGKRLRFHCLFVKFYVASTRHGQPPELAADSETLQAARAFLHCITETSPVSKGRMRYMADFGFVMLVFVCAFVLRLLSHCRADLDQVGMTASEAAALRAALINDVREVADLLTSLSPSEASVIAAYGQALRGACRAVETTDAGPSRPRDGDLAGVDMEAAEAGGFSFATLIAEDDMGMPSGIGMPWFGNFADMPGRSLLDVLDVPWQY